MEEAFRLAKEAGDNTNLMRAYNNIAIDQVCRRSAPTATGRRSCARDSSSRSRSGTIAERRMDLGEPRRRRCSSSGGSRRARSTSGTRSTSLDRVGDEPLIGHAADRAGDGGSDARDASTKPSRVPGRGRARSWRRTRSRRGLVVRAAVRRVPGARAGRSSCRGGSVRRGRRACSAPSASTPYPEVIAECPRDVPAPRRSRGRGGDVPRPRPSSTDSIQSAAHATQHRRGCSNRDPVRVASAILREAVAEFERLETAHLRGARDGRPRPRDDASRPRTLRELLERARAILLECDAHAVPRRGRRGARRGRMA